MTPFWTQLKFVLPYLRPHRRVLVASLTLSLMSTALGMVQPYFAKIIIDRVFLGGGDGLLAPLLSLMIALVLAGFLVRIVNNYIYTRYSARFLFKLREALFEHLHQIPLKFFSRNKIGDIYSRIATDMAEVQGVVTDTLPQYLFNLITCSITVCILFWLHWQMALMSLLVIPLGLFIIYKLRPHILSLSRNVTETNADIAHFLFESLSSTHMIRAYAAESVESQKLHSKQNKVLRFLLRYQIMGAFSGSVPILFIIINTLIVFGYGGMRVLEGSLTVGSLVAFSIYQGRLLGPLQAMMEGYFIIQKTQIALKRVREILDIPKATIISGSGIIEHGQLQGAITFNNVTFAYEADAPVFDNLCLSIPPRSVTALVGPSGAGKTTICHLILRLFDPLNGEITLDGKDLKDLDIKWLRRQFALVSQDTCLFHASIGENIGYANPGASRREIVKAARAACIDDFVQTLPQGYDTQIGDRGLRLSGGQRQRVSIARAILLDPKILILDEATAFVDPETEDRLKITLKNLMRNRVVLVVSHRASSIQGADQVITLAPGQAGVAALKSAPDKEA